MDKGEKRTDWTRKEEQWLIDHAGKMPLATLCEHLKRTPDSVKQKAKSLRTSGTDISLRYQKPLTIMCPTCGRQRSLVRERTGKCRVCELNDLIAELDAKTARLLSQMPQEKRLIYERQETHLGSRIDQLPPQPITRGLSPANARRAREIYALKVEEIEIRNLERKRNARRRRYQRMRDSLNV